MVSEGACCRGAERSNRLLGTRSRLAGLVLVMSQTLSECQTPVKQDLPDAQDFVLADVHKHNVQCA